METHKLKYVTLSRTQSDWTCPRKRFWAYEHMGRGLSKAGTNQALYTGQTLHDCLAVIGFRYKEGLDVNIDEIAETAYKQMMEALTGAAAEGTITPEVDAYAKEQATLVEGLIRGYYKHVWPRLLEKYPVVVGVEQEATYSLSDTIKFIARPDLIMADPEGGWHYIEFKSTSSKKEEWIQSWETAVQLHSSVKAVEQTFGILPEDVTIVGFYKGYVSYSRQNSPICYGYKRSGNPPFTQDQIQYEYKAGFKKFASWEMEGGVKAWIDSMPEEILANQFPMTPPIYVNEDMIEAFFKQRKIREEEIESFYGNEDIDRIFPQKFESCQPAYGFGCEYKKLCFGHVEDPATEGFELRVPHMDSERAQLGLDEDGND